MDIDELVNLQPPSNNENEKPKITPITKGTKEKKPGVLSWMYDHFISMKPKDIIVHVLDEVVAPGVKQFASDVIDYSKNLLLFGDGDARDNRYTHYGSKSEKIVSAPPTKEDKMRGNFTNVEINTRADAQQVREQMIEWMAQYGEVTVANFYSWVGVESDFTDERYGWRSFPNGLNIVPLPNSKYKLGLPKAVPLTK